jgi:hypothetical protein
MKQNSSATSPVKNQNRVEMDERRLCEDAPDFTNFDKLENGKESEFWKESHFRIKKIRLSGYPKMR